MTATDPSPVTDTPPATDASGAIPTSISAAVMTDRGTTRVEQRPTPALGSRDVLVEIAAVGVCGSDVHWYLDGHIGDTWVTEPLVLGHEASGRIVAVGDEVDPNRIGERVALEPGVPCRECAQCLAGRYNLCRDVRFFATPPIDGAFATHVAIDAAFAHPVPDSLGDAEAALVEPLAVAVWAARAARIALGDRLLVTGAGPIGLLVTQVARAAGATVTVSDVAEHRLTIATELGAAAIHVPGAAPLPDGGFDVLIECSGAAAAITGGLRSLAPAGRAVLVGMSPDPDVAIPLDVMQGRELTLTGTFRYANTYPTAIDLAARGAVDLARLVTSRHGLDDVHAALTRSHEDPTAIKAVVTPNRPHHERRSV